MNVRTIHSQDGTGTLSHLVCDAESNVGVLIDPTREGAGTIEALIREKGCHVRYIVDTHTHADHYSGAGELRERLSAEVVMHEETTNKWKIVDEGDKFGIGDILRHNANIHVDRYIRDGDTLSAGNLTFRFLHTPGHTDNHVCVLVGDAVFTGDLLLIGQAGRSDLPGGNPVDQYHSLFMKIMTLPDTTTIYPGHDYENHTSAYLHDEKRSNPFLQSRTLQEYLDFVRDYFPPVAESTGSGLVTLQCGTKRVPTAQALFRTISTDELVTMMEEDRGLFLLDVREAFELAAFGAIPGVKNIPISQFTDRWSELPADTSLPIVTICQSGGRSYEIAHLLSTRGYANIFNLDGGTFSWKQRGRPLTYGSGIFQEIR